MLTMVDIKYIKDLYDKKGLSLNEIARTTGYCFRTVRKYIDVDDWSKPVEAKRKSDSQLDAYKAEINKWLEEDVNAPRKQRRTAKKIHKDLKKKFRGEFDLSYRTVARYVTGRKKLMYGDEEGSIPLYHPGGEAQADFGQAEFYENGMWFKGYYVTASFPYSNGGYIQLFKGANMECLLEGLRNIFEHIGKVPACIWFDNDTTIVKKILAHGKREVTEGFLRFRMHYGFETNFCNPDSGNEKGHVENKVGYTRRNFLAPVPRFNNIREFNKQLLQLCDEDMQREHYEKGIYIYDLFERELKTMNRLPANPFVIGRLVKAKANKYGMVNLDNKRYSSSPKHAQRELWIKADAFTVTIMDEEYNVVQKHERLYGDRNESMEWGPYLNLISRRPTALKYTEFFQKLPDTLRNYLSGCGYEEKKQALKLMGRMLEDVELDKAVEAFDYCVSKGLYDLDSIWSSYYTITHPNIHMEKIELGANIPDLEQYDIDCTVYDSLLRGGKKVCVTS